MILTSDRHYQRHQNMKIRGRTNHFLIEMHFIISILIWNRKLLLSDEVASRDYEKWTTEVSMKTEWKLRKCKFIAKWKYVAKTLLPNLRWWIIMIKLVTRVNTWPGLTEMRSFVDKVKPRANIRLMSQSSHRNEPQWQSLSVRLLKNRLDRW